MILQDLPPWHLSVLNWGTLKSSREVWLPIPRGGMAHTKRKRIWTDRSYCITTGLEPQVTSPTLSHPLSTLHAQKHLSQVSLGLWAFIPEVSDMYHVKLWLETFILSAHLPSMIHLITKGYWFFFFFFVSYASKIPSSKSLPFPPSLTVSVSWGHWSYHSTISVPPVISFTRSLSSKLRGKHL